MRLQELVNALSEEFEPICYYSKLKFLEDKSTISNIVADVIVTNRHRKIDSIMGNKPFVEMKYEDHPNFNKKIWIFFHMELSKQGIH